MRSIINTMSSIIIVGFQGIGKTSLLASSNTDIIGNRAVIELNEYKYHYYPSGLVNPNFPMNYITIIKQAEAIYDIVLLGFSNATLSALLRCGISDYVIVYPTILAEDEYKSRYSTYVKDRSKREYLSNNFINNVNYIENLDIPEYNKYKLTINQHLSDVIIDVIDTYNAKKLVSMSNVSCNNEIKRRDINARKKKNQTD